jgi:hypothetical protein
MIEEVWQGERQERWKLRTVLLGNMDGSINQKMNNLNLFFALLPVRPLILERDRSTNSVLTTQCYGSGATDETC